MNINKEYSLIQIGLIFGFSFDICLDNSAPIVPPAPVTKTVLEAMYLESNSLSGLICSLFNKSSIKNL